MVVPFDLKPLIQDGNLQVYMHSVCALKWASGAPEHNSEHVKSQNFLGVCLKPSSHNIVGPHFSYLSWTPPPPNPLGGPGHKVPSMLSGHILIFSVAILYLLHMTGDLYLNTLNLKLTLTLSCLNPGVHFQGGWGMRRTLTVKKLGGRGSLDLFSQLMQCSQVPRGKGGWARLWQGGQMHVGVRWQCAEWHSCETLPPRV